MIRNEDLDSSAFNIQGIGFATGLPAPTIGCRDIRANNYNIDTGGLYGVAGASVLFNTHAPFGHVNDCTYDGCTDQNSSTYSSFIWRSNTYYATTDDGSCLFEGCDDPLAYNNNTTCGGYVLPMGIVMTTSNTACCNYPESFDCDTVVGGYLTIGNGTGQFVVCHDFYDPLALPSTPTGCYATPADAVLAASSFCPACIGLSGCTDQYSLNYDPLAICNDGCIAYTLGCMDDGNMTTTSTNSTYGTTIWPTQSPLGTSLSCTPYDSYIYTVGPNAGNGVQANNYNPLATGMDCSCEYHGCTDSNADNFEAFYTVDDGSCVYSGCTDPLALNTSYFTHPNPTFTDSLGNIIVLYTNPILATIDDGSCNVFGCNDIQTPNVLPWNAVSIKETVVSDVNFEELLESYNDNMGNQIYSGGLTLGYAEPPLIEPQNPSCGIPSTWGNNLVNAVDQGNGFTGTCTAGPYLSYMEWDGTLSGGNITHDGLVCSQGFANAWGPFPEVKFPTTLGHFDGFYLTRLSFGVLTSPGYKTAELSGGVINDLTGLQDFALNPNFQTLAIHLQMVNNFEHSESDVASPYFELDMLKTLFLHAPMFNTLSLKSIRTGGSSDPAGKTLDLTPWTNCQMVELVDLAYEEININHIDNPNCHSISIVNDNAHLSGGNDNGNNSPNNQMVAASGYGMYSHNLNIDWTSHTPGTIPIPVISDQDQSWRGTFFACTGMGYKKSNVPTNLKQSWMQMYSSTDLDPNGYTVGEHFPKQPSGFTGWDPVSGNLGDAATHFVPQYKLINLTVDHTKGVTNNIAIRGGTTEAWPSQNVGPARGNGAQSFYNDTFRYQGDIPGSPNLTLTNGSVRDGFAWNEHPSSANLGGNPHGQQVGNWYGPGSSNTYTQSFTPPDPSVVIDNALTYSPTQEINDLSTIFHTMTNRLVLINLPNLKHVWLGPDWLPKHAMNQYQDEWNFSRVTLHGINPKSVNSRAFSIKGCGNGSTVYVHTAGRAMEFKKRYGTTDVNAVNQFGGPIHSSAGEAFFLLYFDSNVEFVD